jgi:hypothetical protein
MRNTMTDPLPEGKMPQRGFHLRTDAELKIGKKAEWSEGWVFNLLLAAAFRAEKQHMQSW